MGENLEKLRKLREAAEARAGEGRALRAKLEEKEGALAGSELEALRAEALGERGWEKKRDGADKLRDQIRALRTEVEKAESLLKAVQTEARRLEPAAIEEITASFRSKYAAKLADLWKQLRAAAAVEQELLEIQQEADLEVNAQFSGPQRAMLTPTGRPDLTLLRRYGEPDLNSPLREFKQRCAMNGYELE